MDAALVLFEDESTMSCWYCRSTLLGWMWELMELCKSVGRKREVGIEGDCWDESAG